MEKGGQLDMVGNQRQSSEAPLSSKRGSKRDVRRRDGEVLGCRGH